MTFEIFEPEVPVEEEIVSLGKSMGLVMDERDVNALVEEHSQELTTEELQELQSQSSIRGFCKKGRARGEGSYLYK